MEQVDGDYGKSLCSYLAWLGMHLMGLHESNPGVPPKLSSQCIKSMKIKSMYNLGN